MKILQPRLISLESSFVWFTKRMTWQTTFSEQQGFNLERGPEMIGLLPIVHLLYKNGIHNPITCWGQCSSPEGDYVEE